MPHILESFGLLLDIFGVILLFRYGLPSTTTIQATTGDGTAAPDRDYRDRMGAIAIALLLAGFLLQLIANVVQLRPGP